MTDLMTLYRAIAGNGHTHTSRPPPQDFGEVIGYLAWYLKQMPDTQHTRSHHLKPSLDYVTAWLRNELVQERQPVSVRGMEWSL